MLSQPLFVVLGGPNGSGKSTAASSLIDPSVTFVNADEIAKTLPGYPSQLADLEAGRIALDRMNRLEAARADFAFETTLASRSLAPRISRLKAAGYFLRLLFVFSPSPEFSIFRVATRVMAGGHDIPEETVRRRYRAGLVNFRDLYLPLADRWIVYDNTGEGTPKIIATGAGSEPPIVKDISLWARFEERSTSDG
jgi:predicted ABC-type ATPase